jgi:hypothetical protein
MVPEEDDNFLTAGYRFDDGEVGGRHGWKCRSCRSRDRSQSGRLRRPNSSDNEWNIVFLSNFFDIFPTELGKKFPPRHYDPANIALRKTLRRKAIESSAIRLRRKVVSVSVPPTM